jgi:hypothetical protein
MRPLLTMLLMVALVQTQAAQVAASAGSVPPGTGIEIELLQDVSSETLKDGQGIPFRLVRPLEIRGATLLGAGTAVTGVVGKVKTSGSWRKGGAFDLTLQPLKLADGTLVPIDFPRPHKQSAKAETATDATTETMALIYYFPLIPVVLIAGARKGKPFNIRSGERYLVYVTAAEAPAPTEPAKP